MNSCPFPFLHFFFSACVQKRVPHITLRYWWDFLFVPATFPSLWQCTFTFLILKKERISVNIFLEKSQLSGTRQTHLFFSPLLPYQLKHYWYRKNKLEIKCFMHISLFSLCPVFRMLFCMYIFFTTVRGQSKSELDMTFSKHSSGR